MNRQRLTILGATGSIGMSTLDVVARHPDRFELFALTAHSRVNELAQLCYRYRPRIAVVSTSSDAVILKNKLHRMGVSIEIGIGQQALADVSSHPDVDSVMAAIVGSAGLVPTLAAIYAGKRVLLANKESLVMAGDLFMRAVRQGGAMLLPIDSEHNAVFQSLPNDYAGAMDSKGVKRVLLTASGGPFRNVPIEHFASITPAEACVHPNWTMGRKISVDSATMMNKGLEVIEAHWLFNVPADKIDVVVHPQSVIHSMVEYIDGSVLAQLGNPDMRTPIAHALAYPDRIESGVASLDLFAVGQLNFEHPDEKKFPCLTLAYQALRAGGNAPVLLNAANEVAVAAFLSGRLSFPGIAATISDVLNRIPHVSLSGMECVMQADAEARRIAEDVIS